MESLRLHGNPPYRTVVLHGGPGALGAMQPVASEIAPRQGTLEPLLTASSIEGQITELHSHIHTHGAGPVIIVGHSWGAWLGFLYASRYPADVRCLILISSGPFDVQYADVVMRTRLARLSTTEFQQLHHYKAAIESANDKEQNRIFADIGDLLFRVDSYHPFPNQKPTLDCRYTVFKTVWAEAEEWRKTGKLLQQGRLIHCPVRAIHGDYDPHPVEGVQQPLSQMLKEFKVVLLSKCGHYPWLEIEARDTFYRALFHELI